MTRFILAQAGRICRSALSGPAQSVKAMTAIQWFDFQYPINHDAVCDRMIPVTLPRRPASTGRKQVLLQWQFCVTHSLICKCRPHPPTCRLSRFTRSIMGLSVITAYPKYKSPFSPHGLPRMLVDHHSVHGHGTPEVQVTCQPSWFTLDAGHFSVIKEYPKYQSSVSPLGLPSVLTTG